MKRTSLITGIATVLLAATAVGAQTLHIGPPGPDRAPVVPDAERANAGLPAWLAGTWAMEAGARWADAVWTSPRGGMILGLGRKGFGAEQESWEALRIVRTKAGVISLTARRAGGAELDYPLAVAAAESIEFANAAHTPQRIRLWRAGQLLMTETSALDGSEAERMNYRPVETGVKD
ncbi:MAG: DUF6265 family protein [Pseudomonadota bacterium]